MANLQNSDSSCVSRSYDSNCTRYFLDISRTIDDYIAMHEVPKDCELLPSIIKEACQRKRNNQHESALLLMMVSAKVLKEVDPDVSTVMFNSDGTWAPLIEIKDDDDLVDTMPVPQKVSDVASTSQSLTVYATYQMITTPPHQMGSDVASTSRSQTVGSDHQRFVPGQMRGSLSGQAYNDYYYRTITLPMQQAEAARSRSGRKLN